MYPRSCAALVTSVVIAVFAGDAGVQAADSISISASSPMVPLLQELADAYRQSHPDVTIKITGCDASVAAMNLQQKKVTVAALTRPATEDEHRRIGLIRRADLVGIPIAMDAVVVFVRPDNPLDSLTLNQVRDVFTHHITTWGQLGVPIDDRFNVHTLNEGTGPAGVLQMRVLKGKAYTTARVSYKSTRDAVDGVAGDLLGIGFGGTGYSRGVKILALKETPDSEPISATAETIQTREYPLAHYVYFYFAGRPEGLEKGFIDFVISPEGQRMVRESKTGLVPLPIRSDGD